MAFLSFIVTGDSFQNVSLIAHPMLKKHPTEDTNSLIIGRLKIGGGCIDWNAIHMRKLLEWGEQCAK